MSTKIFLRRGNKVDLPTLSPGEPGLALDSKELYVGHSSGNLKVGVVNPWGDTTQSTRSRVSVVPNVAQNISANTATKVLFQQANKDNLAEYNASLSRYVAKNAGTIDIKGVIQFSSGMSTTVSSTIIIYYNGSVYHNLRFDAGSASAAPQIPFQDTLDLNANDFVEIYLNTSAATALGTGSYLNITRIA